MIEPSVKFTKEHPVMNKLKLLINQNQNLSDYTLSLVAFCLPMTLFCLLVSWGIETIAKEMFRLS
jgi:hypothetical protein